MTSARRTALLAILGIALFVTDVVLLPLAQLGHYSSTHQTISELALGRFGWVQNVAFCAVGVGMAALGATLQRVLPAARFAPVALFVAAALDVVSAVFHAVRTGSPATTASRIHIVAGTMTFFIIVVAMFTLVRHMRRLPGWEGYARTTLVWAVVAAAALIGLGPRNTGHYFGVGQRVIAATFMSWMLVTAWRVLHPAPTARPAEVDDRQLSRAL